MFALIDCNNFYASCERLFRPDLRHKPIIVLSNNDGCVIARSNEAKALGIGMGEPFFKVKPLCRAHGVIVFSSNYTFYGDMSHRVMTIIEDQWNHVEIYSIDEAFLDLSTLPESEHTRFCQTLQKRILKETGIPTSIGIGQTKTLAKIANHVAKKQLKIPVFNITAFPEWLDKIDLGEVWGIGRRWSLKLLAMNIRTAGDLARTDLQLIHKRFNVVLQRTAYELRGTPCLGLEEIEPKQSIISSKSFGSLQTNYQALAEAISNHVARAWEKMRQQQSVAQYLSVFVLSNKFRADLPQYSNALGFKLITPTDDLRSLTRAAKLCLKQLFKENIHYKKVGVTLADLIPKTPRQADLFHAVEDSDVEHCERLMHTIGRINARFGRSILKLAAEGHAKPWSMQRTMKSPSYTTQWGEIPIVLIKELPKTSPARRVRR
ncbi:Y-family DNA polymerase [Legionella impletisoli]|uniref:SOS mutagenesis and repair UmuC protein n=1 Tax=Legionella impletisoli TaxID=343510 RepID=A0A917JZX2_9GAMM|nr:Y-family DNA polymerase [Legionella impletisoli]GGI93549.1 SOS mutagenesis and repair UmuC protein [Legionella impletisoli]